MDRPVHVGIVKSVAKRSFAHQLGMVSGDTVVSVNGHKVDDVIDVQFYASDYDVKVTILRDGRKVVMSGLRDDLQPLGIEFEHPTFDIDIRRCNNLCEFCFVLQMAPRMRKSLYIKDDDYRYSFLFGHFVTLTNLSGHDEWRIMNQRLSPLYVSVHAVDPKVRRECLRNPVAPKILPQLKRYIGHGIEFHTQIVVTPGLNDGPILAESIKALAKLYPGVRSVSVVPVGLTKQHKYGKRPNTSSEANQVLDTCHHMQSKFKTELGTRFVYPTDEWYLQTQRPIPEAYELEGIDLWANGLGMVRRFIDDWNAVKREIRRKPISTTLTIATASLFGSTLLEYVTEFSRLTDVKCDVIPVVNQRLGLSITVAGLLMGHDVINQLQHHKLGEVVVLPRLMFDHPDGISLDDVTPMEIARQLGRPVALVDLMGDVVDLIYGRPALYFNPASGVQIPVDAIQYNGGWAVEKYL